ncbi:DUF6575 domain-containing protein [Clostridium ihumii]|uniref:DUF6575 domain-containing protein n=1 Tax=Clostridium ihumii TaxID=1470356 RepID=UPI000556B4B4|nr:DUF6575 domain-containing protein [Clostridium ihumii]
MKIEHTQDKPLTFSCVNDYGQLFIANCIELEEYEQWLFVPISEARLIRALRGNIRAYDIYKNPEGEFLWKVTISAFTYKNGSATIINSKNISDDDLPEEDIVYSIYESKELNFKKEESNKMIEESVLERREILDISLEPNNTHEHEMDIDVLGKFLEKTQNIVNLIAYKKGISRNIPQKIKENNKLKCVNLYAASFGIRMKSDKIANILNESDLQNSLNVFMDILENNYNVETLMDIFKNLNPLVSVQYKEFLRFLKKENLGIKTYFASPNKKYRHISINKDEISKNLEMIENEVSELEKEIEFIVNVVAINVSQNKFEFETNDGIIKGIIYEGINIEEYRLPKRAQAKIKVISALNNITMEESIKYILLNLVYLDDM